MSGDHQAEFEATALPLTRALYGGALRLTRNPEDASDLVQDTFLRAYRTFDNFTRGTNVKAWLFTILYSVFVNRYRRRQREPESLPVDEIEKRFPAAVATFEADRLAEQGFDNAEVENALRRLPEEFRSAVLLVDVEGFSYEEASSVLGCPVGTVRSRLFRGRKQLFVGLLDYARRSGLVRGS